MSNPAQSTSNGGASGYSSEKPKAASPTPKPATPRSAPKSASKRSATEINYPDPLPGGFMPGKKSRE
ncbi:hypothetical protein O1611_g7146 [Lasiodiplodia mahajangana]|uniref:Uncharacterized protein n=1 Tax=Lasiodiplodia mahajangana TaxID=1108764 RepID=A0ACC2JGL8_9PEZI|nr:hypothetical protein O1611_g7146 [Lasiodiplodia mahajangana]